MSSVIAYIVCSFGIQSQAFGQDSYKTLTHQRCSQEYLRFFDKHAMINGMETSRERILLVENDPQTSQLIAEQTLRPLGYQVDVIASASPVILDFAKFSPDLIITNLHLPEISGKDLMVALTAEGIKVPFIVITPKGHENDALQAFRLGAVNFISSPIRETEVVNVVEDTLSLLRRRNELESFSHQLDQAKADMERRIRDFTEIFSISKLVSSVANQQLMYEKITNAALQVTRADASWILVHDLKRDCYILRSCLNTDEVMQSRLNHSYEDGLSSIVALSGHPVSIHADSLDRFQLAGWVASALMVPIKKKEQTTGMLAVVRRKPEPFTKDQQTMLEMLAEYTAILLDNSLRFQMLEQRLGYLQQSGIYAVIDSDLKKDLLHQASREIQSPLKILLQNLDALSGPGDRRLSPSQASALGVIRKEVETLIEIVDSMNSLHQASTSRMMEVIDLCHIVHDVVNRYLPFAQVNHITILQDLPAQPCKLTVFSSQITKVIEGMVSNAIKFSPQKSQVTISMEFKDDHTVLKVKDQGDGVNESLAERLFDKSATEHAGGVRQFCGIGISLPMMKEIITAHHGEIWIDSGHTKGFTIAFSLPYPRKSPE
jgi:signal transduction histidine kinase/FixJ family two-component response regulator